MSEYIIDFKNAERVSHFESLFADFTAPIHEEIVRCRDCEFGVDNGKYCAEGCADSWDWRNVEPDGFCAWASRRES